MTGQIDDEVTAGLLGAARAHDLTYTHRGLAGTAYRWWSGEHEYRLLTTKERAALRDLIADGTVRLRPGWQAHRGFVLVAGDHFL